MVLVILQIQVSGANNPRKNPELLEVQYLGCHLYWNAIPDDSVMKRIEHQAETICCYIQTQTFKCEFE
jgi:hypothetical protein